MLIRKIDRDQKRYLDLLLLADEQESMIDCYLERGKTYVMEAEEAIAVCVVTDEGSGVLELKNLAVKPEFQQKGYGKAMIAFLAETYQGHYRILQVGTGDVPSALGFYENCGFRQTHKIPGFFTDHYDHPMYEDGVQLVDMVYLQKEL